MNKLSDCNLKNCFGICNDKAIVKFLKEDAVAIDLTHTLDADTIMWPGNEGFNLCMSCGVVNSSQSNTVGTQSGGKIVETDPYFYSAGTLSCAEHGGTHIDAPYHFSSTGATVEAIPLGSLIGQARCIDITRECSANPDYSLTKEDILAYEEVNGIIEKRTMVIIRTGWSQYYTAGPKKYLGYDQKIDGPYNNHPLLFPGIGRSAAELLVERECSCVGIDTASIDNGSSTSFITHRILLGAGIYGIENLNYNVMELPTDKAFTLIALPLKITGGSGSPARVVAIL